MILKVFPNSPSHIYFFYSNHPALKHSLSYYMLVGYKMDMERLYIRFSLLVSSISRRRVKRAILEFFSKEFFLKIFLFGTNFCISWNFIKKKFSKFFSRGQRSRGQRSNIEKFENGWKWSQTCSFDMKRVLKLKKLKYRVLKNFQVTLPGF